MSERNAQAYAGKKGRDNPLFDLHNDYKTGSIGDDDANFASPTSSQFIQRDKQNRKLKTSSLRASLDKQVKGHVHSHQESLEEALVDLYLSVKIRSNEEVSH